MKTILLVDDDKHATEALAATLRILGYTADIALSGEDATRRLAVSTPDMAIVDLNLPGASGLDVIGRMIRNTQPVFCCLATGMADYSTLRRTLSAGGWTLLSKPFQLADLNAVVQMAAVMRSARSLSQTMREAMPRDLMTITRRGDTPVNSEDLARAMRFAEQSGADPDTARRRLPIVVYELMMNARVHGAGGTSEGWYRLQLENAPGALRIIVTDSGRGFGWNRELSRARTGWERSKAGGLQLVSALCGAPEFSSPEHTATATITKTSIVEQAGISLAPAAE